MTGDLIPDGYGPWLDQLKTRISASRSRAALAVDVELIQLYHQIGGELLARREAEGWGAKILQRLAADLKEAFPDIKGFSTRNLHYMRLFAEQCPDGQFVQQPAAQLPWFHVVTLLTKAQPAQREWYATQAIAEGWSRITLEKNLKNRLHDRQGGAVSNFALRLPEPDSALAQEVLKDP